MTWAGWCTADDVEERVNQLVSNTNWGDAKVESRIDRAERFITAKLTGLFGATTIAAWTTTCPPYMADVCADLAGSYVLSDWHGEAQLAEGEPGKILYERAMAAIDAILDGMVVLVDSAGTAVATVCDQIESTTREVEPMFTMHKQVQDDTLAGSLDDF
jgi:hypothetical protein